MRKTWVGGTALMLALVMASGCLFFGKNRIKALNLQVTSLKYGGTGLTGSKLNVSFNIHNPNVTPLIVESFRYELSLNGEALGSGYYPNRMELAPNAEQKVADEFEISLMKTPANVQNLLQQDHVLANVTGKFFIAGGETMTFKTKADVSMQK